MKNREKPSIIVCITTPLMLILMVLGSFIWFGSNMYNIGSELLSSSTIIAFNKGIFYMMGVGLGLSTLAFVVVNEYWLGEQLTEKLTQICTKMAMFSIAIMIILPQITHYSVDRYLTNKNYTTCSEASHQWLLAREIIYVKNTSICDGITEKGNH